MEGGGGEGARERTEAQSGCEKKDDKIAAKWKGVRQEEVSQTAGGGGGADREKQRGVEHRAPLLRKRYPLTYGTFNSIPRYSARRETIRNRGPRMRGAYMHAYKCARAPIHGEGVTRSCER